MDQSGQARERLGQIKNPSGEAFNSSDTGFKSEGGTWLFPWVKAVNLDVPERFYREGVPQMRRG